MVKSYPTYTARTPRVHRRVAACGLVLAAMLAGCTPAAAPPSAIPLRNPTAPLGGTTRFNVNDFAGDWHTVVCLGRCADHARYAVATDGVFLRQTAEGTVPYLQSGPGVLRQNGGGGTLVVMWVDEGFRTAAVGDADGAWAAVIDRRVGGAADRLTAATEILDFYGWDVSQLRKVN